MTFTTVQFLIFLCAVFLVYYAVPKKYQWVVLLIASYIFYLYAGVRNIIYILATTLTTFFLAKKIDVHKQKSDLYFKEHKADMSRDEKKAYKEKTKSERFKYLLACLLINFGILAVVKYTDFMIGNINSLFGTNFDFFKFVVPLGISYYTFMTMGYVIDVYRGKTRAQNNIFKFALFTSFFPSLVQGPIGRYDDVANTLFSEHDFDTKQIYFGFQRILWGYFKKVVIADRVLVGCKTLFNIDNGYTGIFVLVGLFFYSLDIYADFTGGIDITIGIAEMFGVKLTENFDRPYFSKDLAEFWRRWHITMCTWFKDYVFYPISVCKPMLSLSKWSRKTFGDKIGKRIPVYLSTLVVWFLTGVWHGAAWHFVVWGLANAVVLLLSSELEPLYAKFHHSFHLNEKRWYGGFEMVRTFVLVSFLRVFDCYGDVPVAFHQLSTLVTNINFTQLFNGSLLNLGLTMTDYIILIVGIVIMFMVSLSQNTGSVREKLYAKGNFVRVGVVYVMIFAIILLGAYSIGFDASSFIYNNF